MSSEVARIRQQIEMEYESAMLGLSGVAIVARHDFIQKRMEGVSQCHAELTELVGEEQAIDTVIQINDDIVGKYRQRQEEQVKRDDPLLNFQAKPLELVAISSVILRHFRLLEHDTTVSKEEREMAGHLQAFYDRLVAQLSGQQA